MTKPRARALARTRFSAPAIESEVLPATSSAGGAVSAFSFGDPEPVMSRRELIDNLDCWHNGRWYSPPIPMPALTRAAHVSPHHASAIQVKINHLIRDFIPHPMLDVATFEALVLDYLSLANAYVERVPNRLGGAAGVRRSLAKYTRRGLVDGDFYFVQKAGQEHRFDPGSVLQLMPPGLDQEIYGVPQWLSALQSAFLNEAAVLFRRRYYLNGSHAGFIMYINEAGLSNADSEAIQTALAKSKGVGNFKNLFLHIPNGKEKGVQLIHPGEAAAKDEFLGIKNTTRDDILAAHRVPPQLLGVVPMNSGGFGDAATASAVFYENEIQPLQRRFLPINDWLGEEVVRFREREAASPKGAIG